MDKMKNGDVVRVTHDCIPKGLIPSFRVKLLYQYGNEGKWYAIKTDEKEYTQVVDRSKIYLLEPEIKENKKQQYKVWKAYKFPNGMIVTYDIDGNQIPDLQGPWTKELEQKIRANTGPFTDTLYL